MKYAHGAILPRQRQNPKCLSVSLPSVKLLCVNFGHAAYPPEPVGHIFSFSDFPDVCCSVSSAATASTTPVTKLTLGSHKS